MCIGWSGHTEDGGTLGTPEHVFNMVRSNLNISDILHFVQIVYSDGSYSTVYPSDKNIKMIMAYPDNFYLLKIGDILEELNHTSFNSIVLGFNDTAGYSVSVNLEGKNMALARPVAENR